MSATKLRIFFVKNGRDLVANLFGQTGQVEFDQESVTSRELYGFKQAINKIEAMEFETTNAQTFFEQVTNRNADITKSSRRVSNGFSTYGEPGLGLFSAHNLSETRSGTSLM